MQAPILFRHNIAGIGANPERENSAYRAPRPCDYRSMYTLSVFVKAGRLDVSRAHECYGAVEPPANSSSTIQLVEG